MRVHLKITVEGIYALETEDYQDEWQAKCDDEGTVEEGNDYPEVPKEFAIECFEKSLEEGEVGLDEVLETADIDVREVK